MSTQMKVKTIGVRSCPQPTTTDSLTVNMTQQIVTTIREKATEATRGCL